MRTCLAMTAMVLLAGAADAQTGSGVIKGRVFVRGTAPAPKTVLVGADAHCKARHPQGLEHSDFSISKAGLAEVLVYLKTGVKGAFTAPATPALLDQKGCQYHPGPGRYEIEARHPKLPPVSATVKVGGGETAVDLTLAFER